MDTSANYSMTVLSQIACLSVPRTYDFLLSRSHVFRGLTENFLLMPNALQHYNQSSALLPLGNVDERYDRNS